MSAELKLRRMQWKEIFIPQ